MGKVILIVEDDPRNLKLFQRILQVAGYTALEAVDGQQCLEAVRRQRPDLILMDIQMPVMDGLEATRILKSDPATQGIPVIALTAFAMAGDRENFIQAGCDDYMAKPIDIKSFLAKVAEYV
ncbi:MAG: response regulator [Desulfobacterales bacterium]|nr:response regulator [Desulfobacterales bacterium]